MKKFITACLLGAVAVSPMITTAQSTEVLGPRQIEVNLEPEELKCLALNIYFEAGVESNAGKVAVTNVVFNRVDSPNFPNTICEVIQQGPTRASWKDETVQVPIRNKCQFSWWCDGKADVPYEGETWEKSKSIAAMMLTMRNSGQLTLDITDGAMYYHADYVTPFWAKTFDRTAKIDTHIFYR